MQGGGDNGHGKKEDARAGNQPTKVVNVAWGEEIRLGLEHGSKMCEESIARRRKGKGESQMKRKLRGWLLGVKWYVIGRSKTYLIDEGFCAGVVRSGKCNVNPMYDPRATAPHQYRSQSKLTLLTYQTQ